MSKNRLRPRQVKQRRRLVAQSLGIEPLELRQLLATIIVNTELDESDPLNNTVSLREAIQLNNGTLSVAALSPAAQGLVVGTPNGVARDSILFGIPAAGLHTIALGSELPAITHPVFVDGYSQSGSVPNGQDNADVDKAVLTVRLDGSGAGVGANGLTINAPNSVVSGMEIVLFSGHGIVISGANSQGNLVFGSFIGTTTEPVNGRDFVSGLGNGGSGIFITSSNNRFGGNNPGLRNVIADNGVGVTFTGPGGTGNLLQNNFILGNAQQGVLVSSSNNTIGEALDGGGNVISGNGLQGIMVTGGPNIQGNVIVGNDIGTDLGSGSGVNLRPKGLDPLPNGLQGILIQDSPNNTIGSLIPQGKNVIAANDADGVLIQGAASTGNRLLNNWIGFNIADNRESLFIANNFDGVRIRSANNTVGGTTVEAANVIANNNQHGIELEGPGATGNLIQGNIIGLNPEGGSDFGNALDGIHITDAGNNTIGGTASGARNTISGNNNGIVIINTGINGPAAASGIVIQGNFIGTGTDGTSDLGNSVDGIIIQGAPNNTIGGSASGAGNVISGNNRGVRITDAGATGNVIQGNFIGTDLTSTSVIANKIDGIIITNGATNATIGGLVTGAGNTVAFNVGNGIRVESGSGSSILSNSVFSNGQLGINLVGGTENAFGVTANSPGGPHAGPNNLQNYPVITSAAPNQNATFVKGTFNSTPSTTFTVQFFSGPAQDPSGFGEGQTLMGTTTLRTDAAGNATFAINIPVIIPVGNFVTATATDSGGSTSEFSNAVASTLMLIPSANPATIFVTTDLDVVDPNDGKMSLREAIELTDGTLQLSALSPADQALVLGTPNGTAQDSILFAIPGSGLHTIFPTTPLPAITHAVAIDGLSQPGASLSTPLFPDDDFENITIQIDGSGAGAGANGLTIHAANCVIDALMITNFDGNGMEISGPNAQGNWLLANFIGTGTDSATGRNFPLGMGNHGSGLLITSSNNRIGSNNATLRNVIFGNGVGVTISGPEGTGNLIQGNFILNNAQQGVLVASSNNTIGEALKGGGNVISSNGAAGVEVTGGPGVQGNNIVGNEIGTEIGTHLRGLAPRPNNGQGVLILDSPNNTIGGLIPDAKNVIAANNADGILITGASSTGNQVLNNWIGFNIVLNQESLNIPNNFDGIRITSANNTIGGTTSSAANVIGINRRHGIELDGPSATGNLIQGNVIGLNPDGGSDFGNTLNGIQITDAANNVIGGSIPGARNTISGNNNGIVILNTGSNGPAAATGNVILGNFIGTGADGVSDLGNSVDGVIIDNAPRNTVGGTVSGAGNVISGDNRGVRISGPGAMGNLVQGNFIGTDLTATAVIHNKIDGIIITSNASSNTVGGAAPGAGNAIAFNVGNGVRVESGTDNAILSNSIFSNNQIGINLVGGTENAFGVTANTPGGPHGGANHLQNYPVLTGVAPSGNATFVQGTFNSTPNTVFTLQFFSSNAQDQSGNGQGQTLIGSTQVTTDGAGNAPFALNVPIAVPSGQFVTATATDPTGNSSEFSNSLPSVAVSIQFAAATFSVNEALGTATITITRTGGTGGAVAVSFATSDGTATAGNDYTAVSGPVFFNAGETTKTVTIPINDDQLVEQNETIHLTLTDPTNGATLGSPSTAVLTIVDNDQTSVSFSSPTYNVAENAVTATITVTRNDPAGALTVSYATSPGTAVPGVDYTNTSGTLTFNPGETTKTFSFPIIDDNQMNPDLTVNLALSNPSTGVLGSPSTAVLTIRDNERPGALQFSGPRYSVVEGAGRANVTVTRVGGQGGVVSVAYATVGGTATAGADYVPVSGRLTFGPGETTKVISIPIRDDRKIESNETINLLLSSPNGGATLGSPRAAVLTIRDNDRNPTGPGTNPNSGQPGPIIRDLHLVIGAGGVTGILLSFNEPLNQARATNLGSYGYFVVSGGADGFLGTSDDRSVNIRSATYDPSRFQVLLTPKVPLPLNSLSQLTVNGNVSNTAGITDTRGNLLDGDFNGKAGGAYRVTVGAGSQFLYNDRNGDLVALNLIGPGLMELRRGADGEAQQLRLVQTVPGRDVLKGHLKSPPTGDGRTTIPVLLGTAGVKVQLNRNIIVGQVSAAGLSVPRGPRALRTRHG